MNQTNTPMVLNSSNQPLLPSDQIKSTQSQALVAREIAQVQAAMMIAQNCRRVVEEVERRIKEAAKRPRVAMDAKYVYPKGGQKVSGLSIRAAETLAQAYGNIDAGITEVERRNGESVVLAYCVDLETNYWKRIFYTVPHRTAKNETIDPKNSRDIYEAVMNSGARRLRNCILAVIPADYQELFEEECDATLKRNEIPLAKRITAMLGAMNELGVTRQMIETRFGCKAESLDERQVNHLRGIFQSLKDEIAKIDDFFKPEKEKEKASDLNSILTPQTPPATTEPAKEAAKEPEPKKALEPQKQTKVLSPKEKLKAECQEAAQARGMTPFDFEVFASETFNGISFDALSIEQLKQLNTNLRNQAK